MAGRLFVVASFVICYVVEESQRSRREERARESAGPSRVVGHGTPFKYET